MWLKPAKTAIFDCMALWKYLIFIIYFFSIKLFNLHYTNKEHTIQKLYIYIYIYIYICKNIYKMTTAHALNLMNYFKIHKAVKITNAK